MRTAFLVFLILSVLTTISAVAAIETPDGGQAFFCPLQKSLALDTFENQQLGTVPAVYSLESKADAKAADIISRLEGLDPERAERWQKWALAFYDEATFLPENISFGVNNGCRIETVLMRRPYSKLNPDQFQIYKKLWDVLDEDQKSVLILHEVIHRDLFQSKSTEFSNGDIRVFSQMLFSDALGNLGLKEYFPALRSLHFVNYTLGDLTLLLSREITVQDGFITAGTLSSAGIVSRPYFALNCTFSDSDSAKAPRALGQITLTQDGSLQSFEASPELMSQPACYPHFFDNHIGIFVGHTWLFGADEKPLVIYGSTAQIQKFKIDYAFLQFRADVKSSPVASALPTVFKFDEDFHLREIGLGGGACRTANNEIKFLRVLKEAPQTVQLAPNGALETKLASCP